ncbi:MAG TPA: hypothetical protein VIK69_01950 [Methylophilaceae bacterium]
MMTRTTLWLSGAAYLLAVSSAFLVASSAPGTDVPQNIPLTLEHATTTQEKLNVLHVTTFNLTEES